MFDGAWKRWRILRRCRRLVARFASGQEKPQIQALLAPPLFLQMAGARFQQIIERNQAKEFSRARFDDGHPRYPFFRHSIDDRAQRPITVASAEIGNTRSVVEKSPNSS